MNAHTRRDVIDDVAVQVRHNHDVELVRIGDELHATIVDDHRLEFDVWIVFGNVFTTLKELSVSQLHNVSFVDGGDFLPAIADGVIEGKLRDPLAFSTENVRR